MVPGYIGSHDSSRGVKCELPETFTAKLTLMQDTRRIVLASITVYSESVIHISWQVLCLRRIEMQVPSMNSSSS